MKLDGKSLERATSLIEKHILNHISKSEIGEVKIENNKIIVSEGVKHEIDVYVTVDLKIGTTLIYIFECKNYKKKKVSKNDIIIFEEKVQIYNAQKGYFVAKQFTKDAKNRALQNKKIELLDLNNENKSLLSKNYITQFESTYIKNCKVNIKVSPAIRFENELDLPIKLKDFELTTIHDLIQEKFKLGPDKATKFRTLKDFTEKTEFKSKYEKVETLFRNDNTWIFEITLLEPIVDVSQYKSVILKIEVSYAKESPQIIFDYDINQKGHYAKLKMRGLFKNDYFFMEITKDEKTNNLFIHNIGT
ncbi:restriction endonuclease [Christiangramia sp. LLG6405-1]|uniref:restriction endonuclease n=1 Tax=Christiangramia sp. LLG6405-1 TaxID=3160832 RepID=UPI00386AC742